MRSLLIFLVLTSQVILADAQVNVNRDDKFRFKDLFVPYAHPYLSNTSVNVGLGFTTYSGELASFTTYSRQNYHLNPHLSLDVQRRMSDFLSWRLGLNFFMTQVKSSSNDLNPYWVKSRSQDAYLALVIDMHSRPNLESRFRKFNIYFLAGAGVGRFDVMDGFTDEKINDGEVVIGPVFPVGVGLQIFMNDFLTVGFEATQRFTLIDELDGISLPNDRPKNDRYLLYGFKTNLKLFNRFKYKGYLRRLGH